MQRLLARQSSWPSALPRHHIFFTLAPFALIVAAAFIHIASFISASSRTIPQLDPYPRKVAVLLADSHARERNAYNSAIQREESIATGTENAPHARVYYTNYAPKQKAHVKKKIVALVEMRNVQDSIHVFFTKLAPIVDSVVVLDDHSADLSRSLILERYAMYKVEALVVKTGAWHRQELQDRQILLNIGRKVGGTHFALLDYDERFEGACVKSGSLKKAIYKLSPRQSMMLPWVELWKHRAIQRVLPRDSTINFLVRRQTVIFADDGTSQYTRESAQARTFDKNSSSIHALRCPRNICAKPPKYQPGIIMHTNSVPRCVITEGRFIHIPNVILKSAWYQALARILDVPASVTSGKMMDALFPTESASNLRLARQKSGISLMNHVHGSMGARDDVGIGMKLVERWRADELVGWLDQLGDVQFSDLSALKSIDTNLLRYATSMSKLALSDRKLWLHLPRLKRGTFVLAISDNTNALEKVMDGTDFATVVAGFTAEDIARNAEYMVGTYKKNAKSARADTNALKYEDWRLGIVSGIRSALSKSKYNTAYLHASTAVVSKEDLAIAVEFLSMELAEFDVVISLLLPDENGNDSGNDSGTDVVKAAVKHSRLPGSHIRVLGVRKRTIASYAALCWLRNRMTGREKWSDADGQSLLRVAESLYTYNDSDGGIHSSMKPVAKLVFSLNTGRSGSKYLAGIFNSLGPGIRGVHEPRCPDNACSGGGAMSMQNTTLKSTYTTRRNIKLGMVYDALYGISGDGTHAFVEMHPDSNHNGDCSDYEYGENHIDVLESNCVTGCMAGRIRAVTYAETNPNFKAWFWDVVLDTLPRKGYKVEVLVVRKYIPATLKSLYETGYFTTRNGHNWMETSSGVNSRIKHLSENGPYEKILAYLLNAEAVTRDIMDRYRNRYKKGMLQFSEVRSESIYSAEGALGLLKRMELGPRLQTLALVGMKSDKYSSENKNKAVHTTLENCERRFQLYLKANAGITLPANMTHVHKYKGFAYS